MQCLGLLSCGAFVVFFCGGGVAVFLWWCGGVFVVVIWWCFCGGGGAFVVVFLLW